jgi:hypothetical protein
VTCPLLYRLEKRGLIAGRWVEKADTAAAVLQTHGRRPKNIGGATPNPKDFFDALDRGGGN